MTVPPTIRVWVAWLTVRSASWACFAWLDEDRWWNSDAYDFLRAVAGIRWWGAVWAACAIGMAVGLARDRVEVLRVALGVWMTVQLVMAISVGVLVGSGTLTAVTALGHFADSVVATGIILASGRLSDRRT